MSVPFSCTATHYLVSQKSWKILGKWQKNEKDFLYLSFIFIVLVTALCLQFSFSSLTPIILSVNIAVIMDKISLCVWYSYNTICFNYCDFMIFQLYLVPQLTMNPSITLLPIPIPKPIMYHVPYHDHSSGLLYNLRICFRNKKVVKTVRSFFHQTFVLKLSEINIHITYV